MPKCALKRENVHPTADGMGGMGMAELMGMEMNLGFPSPAAHPFSNRLTTQRAIIPV